MKKKIKLSLAVKIFIALILGIIVGFLFQNNASFATKYIMPFGKIFLNLVQFIVIPVVMFSIIDGIISMKDIKKVGSLGGIAIVYYLITTVFAISIGLCLGSLFKGFFPMIYTSNITYQKVEPINVMDTIVNIFPSNFIEPIYCSIMLQVIVMAIILGFGILLAKEKATRAIEMISAWNAIFCKCMDLILQLSPIGVFCLLCPVIAENGVLIIGSLTKIILVVYLSFVIHAVLVYSISLITVGGVSPIKFFKKMIPAMMFAFSSASSIGTLPINMSCTENLGATRDVSSFVLPLGATINMDGTAIFQGVCAIFIASCYGIDLTFGQMLTVVCTATLASIGTAGVPGAGMIMLSMVLLSVGLPVDGIALVAGVDRIFDMGRTVLNITGDAVCTMIVSNFQKKRNKYVATVEAQNPEE